MNPDFTKLERLLEDFAARSVPGCTCTVMQGDRVLYEGAAGCADLASGKKTDGHSMFRQASTTKLFTYAILGMLYKAQYAGNLSIEPHSATWQGDLGERGLDLTIRYMRSLMV